MVMPINHLAGGKKLPVLSNPATAAQILSPYQAIDGEGKVLDGTMAQGKKFASGTFESAFTNSKISINTGFKAKYVMLWWSDTYNGNKYYGTSILSGSNGYTFSFNAVSNSAPSSSGVVGNAYAYTSSSLITKETSGFSFKTPRTETALVTINYCAFGD